jgi:vacuolar protein sorting-associated protein 45
MHDCCLSATAEVPGYKGILVDKDTMRVCSTLFGRTELAEHSVVHIERLDSNDGKQHLELKVRM